MRWLRDGGDSDGKDGCLVGGSRLTPGIMQPAVWSMKGKTTLATIRREADMRLDGWLENDSKSVPAGGLREAETAYGAQRGLPPGRGLTPGAEVSPTPRTAGTPPMASLEAARPSQRALSGFALRCNRQSPYNTVISRILNGNELLPDKLQR